MAKKVKANKANTLGDLETQFTTLASMREELEHDFEKFKGGTRAAGSRVRKSLMIIRKTAQEMRKSTMIRIKEMQAERK
jgi:hypothetical protein